MKYSINFLAVATLLLNAHLAAQEAPDIIARVGDYEISAEEFQVNLEYRMTAAMETQGRMPEANSQFRMDTLAEMIDARILKTLAKNEGFDADPNKVSEEYDIGVLKLGGPDKLPEYLAKFKLTEEQLREEIRERLQMEAYIANLTNSISVSDTEIKERYESLLRGGLMERKKETLDFGYLFVRPADQSTSSFNTAKAKIQRAYERLKKEEEVEQVAKELSDDPLLPMNNGIYLEMDPETMMMAKTAIQLSQMKPGEITEPFMTGEGWHVIKLIQRNTPGSVPLDRVRGQIESMLLEEKKSLAVQGTVDKAKLVMRVEIYPVEMQEEKAE